jgi:hypothetical protein
MPFALAVPPIDYPGLAVAGRKRNRAPRVCEQFRGRPGRPGNVRESKTSSPSHRTRACIPNLGRRSGPTSGAARPLWAITATNADRTVEAVAGYGTLRICRSRLAPCPPCLCVFHSSLPRFRPEERNTEAQRTRRNDYSSSRLPRRDAGAAPCESRDRPSADFARATTPPARRHCRAFVRILG